MTTIPALPTDRVRLHVTMWAMARALGLGWTTVDSSRSDNDLLEEIAQAVGPALARAFREGACYGRVDGPERTMPVRINPYGGEAL